MLSSFRHIEFDPKQRQQFVLNFDVKKGRFEHDNFGSYCYISMA